MYRDEVKRDFRGSVITPAASCTGIEKVRFVPPQVNSGAAAIALAHQFGARRVVMLGYDCQKDGKRVHWHGDHPAGLMNAGSMPEWQGYFGALAKRLPGMQVVNASRVTALDCFDRADLEEALCEY